MMPETGGQYVYLRDAIVFGGLWTSLLILTGSYETWYSYTILAAWIFYTLTVAAVYVLRRKRPDLPRPYRMWVFPTPSGFLSPCPSGLCSTRWSPPPSRPRWGSSSSFLAPWLTGCGAGRLSPAAGSKGRPGFRSTPGLSPIRFTAPRGNAANRGRRPASGSATARVAPPVAPRLSRASNAPRGRCHPRESRCSRPA